VGSGVNFGIFGNPVLNNSGQVAFRSALTGTGVTGSNDEAIYRDTTLIAREGNAAPGAGSGVNFGFFAVPVLNNTGQVAFWSLLTGTEVTGSNDQAIYRDSTLIAREGNAAPGVGSGVNFGFLNNPVLNNTGQVAFQGFLTGTGVVTGSNDRAIWRDSTLIARRGDPAPGTGSGVNFGGFDDPILNNSGQVAFFSGLTGNGVTGANDFAIWLGDGVEQVKVAREGDSLAGSTISFFNLSRDSLNDYGQVAYQASLVNGNQGVFLFTPELHWRRNFSDYWDNRFNWTLGLGPAHVHDVFIDPAISATVFGPTGAATVKSLTVGGGAGIGTLQLNGGALTATNGVNVLATGVLTGDGVITSGVNNQGTVRANNVTIGGGLVNAGLVEGSGRINADLTNQTTGEVRVGAGEQMLINGSAHSNAGRIEVIGGELEFNGALTNQLSMTSSSNITGRDATLRFNGGLTNEGNLALSFGTSDVFGDINNTKAGKIINSGAGQITFYDDVANDGEVRTSTGGATVFFGAVSGAGGYTGTGTVFFEGDLAPGNSPALISVGGDMVLGSGSFTLMELAGLDRGSEYDAFDIGGALSLDGTLSISLLDGFNPFAGSYFDLFAADSISGSFSQLLFPELAGGLSWNLALLTDFSGGTDYLRLSAVSAVPVPPAVWLFGSGLIGLAAVTRRRQSISMLLHSTAPRLSAV
jgi:hypothetical protein